tara:strand:- start:14285 stop:15727 length:1443 start_codon:yes stop_codon:yes gene_type:complete
MANFLKLNKSYLGPELMSNGSFEEYGPDLVINGDFATDSVWSKGAGWTISNGKASNDGSNGNLTQASILEVGKVYLITITVSDYVSGGIQVSAGAGPRGTVTANGTYTFIQTAQSNSSFYVVSSVFVGSVESVSVQESGAVELVDNGQFIAVTDGTDVTTLSQWGGSTLASQNIVGNALVCVSNAGNQFVALNVTTVSGTEYKLKVGSIIDGAANSLQIQSPLNIIDTTSGSVDVTFTADATTTVIKFYAGDRVGVDTTTYANISLQATNQFAYDFERDGDTGQYSIFDLQSKTVRLVAFELNTKVKVKASLPQGTTASQEYLIKIDVAEVVGSAPFIFFNGSTYTEINLEVGENEFRYKRTGSGNSIIFGIQAVNSSQIGSSITLNSISLQEVVNQPKLIGVDNVSMVSAPTDNTVVINNGLTDGADTLTITYAGASASSRVQMRNFFQDSIVRLANSNNTAEVLEITPPVLITDIVAS